MRDLTRRTGTLLIIDETHTICAGPGGYTAAHGLEPDLLTIGKPIAAGLPTAAYGMTNDVADRVRPAATGSDGDVSGIGGTLAGNALALAAMRVTLTEVLTDAAFEHTLPLGARWEAGVQSVIDDRATSRGASPASAPEPSTGSCPSGRVTAPRPRPASTRSSTASCTSTRSTAGSS